MKKLVLILGVTTLLSLAYASDKIGWTWEYKPFKGAYTIYAGELGERVAPTLAERKLAVRITGQPAKEIFDSIYPDEKETCAGEKGDRSRVKGNVWCTFQRAEGYTCYFGFNLRTGESIPGAIC